MAGEGAYGVLFNYTFKRRIQLGKTKVQGMAWGNAFRPPPRPVQLPEELVTPAEAPLMPQPIVIPELANSSRMKISLKKCSFAEILDAYRKRGIARKKRDNLHGLASTNRSFAHFKWW
ncbi:hypothetical protein M9H77_23684 [Catharanthus roseus]|uniref:Uncharacterized protein n=1 Tax=Catharanthus roseus TaxID=4058 RepID=A0ACC0AUF0_CATRO|nr:hypothetical protein M9H77_23684 [Catharanthus roseus]